MGNTPSLQQGSDSVNPGSDTNHRFKRLQEMEKGRQHSITSQLFPSRNSRHSLGRNLKKARAPVASGHGPSVFKTDYSMDENHKGSSATTESIRDDMAGLSIKGIPARVAETPPFLSPGPSASTVQPTRQEVVSMGDLNSQKNHAEALDNSTMGFIKDHRPSVVALMKSLHEDADPSGTSSRADTKSPPIDIYGALSLKSPNFNKSMDSENIVEDGYLQSEDVVLNESLLQDALKKDMKRKRPNNNSNVNQKKNNISTNTSREAMLKVSNNSFSYESLDNGSLPELKKLKSLSADDGLLPSFQSTSVRNEKPDNERLPTLPHSNLLENNFDRIDSFETQSIEHREGIQNTSASPAYSSDSSNGSERVHVILKFRDHHEDSASCRVAILSPDMLSALNFGPENISASTGLPMRYNESDQSWEIPDLFLPAGIYKLRFLVDGFVRHSNFLPTATDSVGNIVNWFEVLPGYETIEPYRDQIDLNNLEIEGNHNKRGTKETQTSDQTSQGTIIAQPVPGKSGRPPLTGRNTSSYYTRQDGTGTPYSDYAGISRTCSSVRKSPGGHQTISSMDLLTALAPKKYEYSSEIPEIFKAGNLLGQNGENQPLSQPPVPLSLHPPSYDQSNFDNNVIDCNQDTVFAGLQQGGLLDAETAEQLFLEKHTVPDLPIYLNSTYLNKIFNEFQHNSHNGSSKRINHIIPHVNLNHLLTSSIRDEMISVGCTTRYEGKFITQVVYAPCYYASGTTEDEMN